MRFIIGGAGGLGSVIGGFLAEAGEDVTLVARQRHVDAIRANGLRISGIRGEHLVRDNLTAITDPSQAEGEFDYMVKELGATWLEPVVPEFEDWRSPKEECEWARAHADAAAAAAAPAASRRSRKRRAHEAGPSRE